MSKYAGLRRPELSRVGSSLFTVTAMFLTLDCQAAMVPTEPGDYAPLPAGTELGLIYFQHAERNRVKRNDHTVTKDFGLDSNLLLTRYVHWTEIGGFLVTPQIILPFGDLKMSGQNNDRATGMGDPIIGSALWLLNDPVKERYFSIAGYLSVPMGEYHAQDGAMNTGENRWKGAFHASYVQAIIPHTLYGEVTLEHDKIWKNDDYQGVNLEQDNVFEVQAHLRYVYSPTNQFGISYYHTVGGETKLSGVSQDDSLNNKTALLTWSHFFTPRTQFETQVGQQYEVQNGPQEKLRLNLRLAHAF